MLFFEAIGIIDYFPNMHLMFVGTTLLDSVSLFRDVVAPHVPTFLSLVNRLLVNQHLSSEVIFTQHIVCVLTKVSIIVFLENNC